MPLIQPPPVPPKREPIKITIEETIYAEIQAYCHWANVPLEYFLEQAVLKIFSKDKEWKEVKKTTNLTPSES